jgi:hypothetical protein
MSTSRLGRLRFGVIGACLYAPALLAAPDFSGRWTIAPSPAPEVARGGMGGRGDMGPGWGSPLTIAQNGAQLTIEYAFFTRGDMQAPLRFVYALDGSETRNSVMMGRGVHKEVSRTVWEGEKLVITTVHSFANPATGQAMTQDVIRKLSLNAPNSLVVETTRTGVLGGPSSTVRTVYTKP